ncbi:MAG: aldose 1-epimerase family protein [Capsulimonadales bacterium]|nr:aldose 1-epimerase family protein [Capsulimonadales bacterium]
MARLFGREWTMRELLERVGELGQIAGVERFTYTDGVRDGVQAARLRSGGGLDYTVLLSRGMDIAHASYRGTPFAWVSATGMAHPSRFEPETRGWLRTFHGGLLTGCGLSNAGAPSQDGDESLGLHGHLSHIPAEECASGTIRTGDEAEIFVSGTLREARVFSENLRLTRRISSPLGGKSLTVTDTVENVGFQTSPLMLLYHLNFGWPLVSETTDLIYHRASDPIPRDAVAAAGFERWQHLDPPTPGYAEQCFFHDPLPDRDNHATVLMINRTTHMGISVAYDRAAFPFLTQWKMMGQGEYVCGIEPANCRVLGRAAEREAGRLQTIAPGEIRRFTVTLTVLDGLSEIAGAEAMLPHR